MTPLAGGMRICVIFNPAARGNKARRFRRRLDALAGECSFKLTTSPGGARELAAEAVKEGYDTVVAAGGDGTVNEVVNGLGDVTGGLAAARFAVLPLGTINVFARELRLPSRLEQAWAVIRSGHERRIDLPEATFHVEGQSRRRYFVQMAGAGLDSRATELLDPKWKQRIGPFAYVLAAAQALRGPQPIVTTAVAGHQAAGEAVLLGNGRFYGGSLVMFPKAAFEDGRLDVRVMPRAGFSALARFGWGWLTHRPFVQPGEQSFQAETVTLTSPEPVPFHLDGEHAGHTPVSFSVVRGALRVACLAS